MKKTVKIIFFTLLTAAALLLCSSCGGADVTDGTEQGTDTALPLSTSVPTDSETDTEKPPDTTASSDTTSSSDTTTETSSDDVTTTPVTTSTTEETNAPEQTVAPETTKTPETTKAEAVPKLDLPAEPVASSTVKVYTAHDKNEAGENIARDDGGATPSCPVKTADSWDNAKALITQGGTFVMVGKGYFHSFVTFEATPAPIVFTGVDGERDYVSKNPDGTIKYTNESMANIGQFGMFMMNANVIVEFKGDVIFDDTVLLSRLSKTSLEAGKHQGVISVTSGGKLVVRENVQFANMAAKKNFDLNVGDGSYAYLHSVGFDKYTGKGTIVLGDEVRDSVNAYTFSGFEGKVVYADGTAAFEKSDEPDINGDVSSLGTAMLEDGAIYTISVRDVAVFGGGTVTVNEFGMENNAILKLESDGGHLSQMWRAHKNSDGTYSFENMASRMSMTLKNPSYVSNVRNVCATEKGTNDVSKSWSVYTADGSLDSCIIKNVFSGLFVTAQKHTDMDSVELDKYSGALSQVWSLEKVSDGDGEYPYMLVLSGANLGSTSCPEIIYHNGVYYNYNMTGPISLKTSTDMRHWTRHPDMYALPSRPEWMVGVSGTTSIWAPGAYKIGDKFFLYYCTSSSGSQNSGIGVAVSNDPARNDWHDQGLVLRSYHGESNFNAIDPNVFVDDDGTAYLLYGSYWTGIYMRELNSETGKLADPSAEPIHLAKGDHDMEAPYLIKHGEYYYLFIARGGLKKGTYYWAVGRSKKVEGPYVDKDGVSLLSGRGGTRLTEWKEGVEGAAHAQLFVGPDGQSYMVTESWIDRSVASPQIRLAIGTVVWTEDGWPVTPLDRDVLAALGER